MTYTVKVLELITHIRKFEDIATLVRDFGHIADLLGPRMGCFLFSCRRATTTPERLQPILGQLDPTRRNVVEFRHPSSWRDDVYAAFETADAIFCSLSGPHLPDPVIRTAEDMYVRFHGIERWYRHDYSEAELSDWARRIQDARPGRIWIYFNNDFDGYAVKNATIMSRLLAA